MDYRSIIQDIVSPGDLVISQAVECTWNEAFRILALVEHHNWREVTHDTIKAALNLAPGLDPPPSTLPTSPESREFVILIFEAHSPPIRCKNDVDLVYLIPVIGSSFSCEIDTESFTSEQDICIKISIDVNEPALIFKLARGHCSQNFIDEVFRSAQIADKQSTSRNFPWLIFYENLMMHRSASQPVKLDVFGGVRSTSSSTNISMKSKSGSEETLDKRSDEDEEDANLGTVRRDQLLIPSQSSGLNLVQGRELILKNILDSKKDLYSDLIDYKIYVATWNVNGQSPGSICLSEWLARTPEPPDIYAIGFQELDLSKEAFLFNDSPREHEWFRAVRAGLHPRAKYKKVKLVRLVGMMLIVFVKEELVRSLHNVVGEYVGTGILGRMGNKGGVAVRFDLEETSICFVNCHLAAHVEEYYRRNQDYQQILTRLAFDLAQVGQGWLHVKDHDQIFWFGDMNYRIDPTSLDVDKAKRFIEHERYADVLKYDQLKEQMKLECVFKDFMEGPITFRPTYKYDPGTDNWDSSEKNRSPAWCDRILWNGDNIGQMDYVSISSYKLSDHKPVSALMLSQAKVINSVRYRKCYEEALKWLDKEENKCLPQVEVDIPGANNLPHSNRNELNFGTVKFYEPVRREFSVRNVGQFAVRLDFINKLNDSSVCKDWLRIEPMSAFIPAGECCEIKLEVAVDKKSAANLNVGRDTLYDILVIHLEGGKDIFITIMGEFERSVFGCSISSLVNLAEPLRNVTPGKLIELEKGIMPVNHYDIPKELWFVVDRLFRTGMQKPLFSQSGLNDEILQIRDWLDEIPNSPMPGGVDSVAEVLLLLLESFPEPVVPFQFHQKCIESASNYAQCKQILKQFPPAHKNVFVYLCSFLRELLEHSEKNGLDAKFLAGLFGHVMLHDPHHQSKPNSKSERQKEAFVHQFLVNEDYGDDL